jgi:hypothetical protein
MRGIQKRELGMTKALLPLPKWLCNSFFPSSPVTEHESSPALSVTILRCSHHLIEILAVFPPCFPVLYIVSHLTNELEVSLASSPSYSFPMPEIQFSANSLGSKSYDFVMMDGQGNKGPSPSKRQKMTSELS